MKINISCTRQDLPQFLKAITNSEYPTLDFSCIHEECVMRINGMDLFIKFTDPLPAD